MPQRGMYHLQSSVLWVGGPAAWGLPLRGSLGTLLPWVPGQSRPEHLELPAGRLRQFSGGKSFLPTPPHPGQWAF